MALYEEKQVVVVKECNWPNRHSECVSVCVPPNINRSTAGSKLLNKLPIRPAVSWLDQHTHTLTHTYTHTCTHTHKLSFLEPIIQVNYCPTDSVCDSVFVHKVLSTVKKRNAK